MTEALSNTNNITRRYPRLFAGHSPDLGISFGVGWSGVIDLLFLRLNFILEEAPEAKFEVIQIKEKFGELRFYYEISNTNESVKIAISEAVALATSASRNCCDKCSARGKMVSERGWLVSGN